MSHRNWRVIVAAFGLLALCGAQPPTEQSKGGGGDQQPPVSAQPSPTPAPTPTPSPTPKFTPYGGYNPDPCYKADDHDAADLCAQWRAALAAEKAAYEAGRATFWSVVATFLSALGVCGLLYTLWQTAGALREAKRGNRIAMKANARATREAVANKEIAKRQLEIAEASAQSTISSVELSRKTLVLTQRARLLQTQVKTGHGPDIETGIMGLVYEVVGKNFGATYAENARLFTRHFILEPGQTLDLTIPPADVNVASTIIPGAEFFSPPNGILVTDLQRVWENQAEAIIWSVCDYNDVFQTEFDTPPRRTVFAAKLKLPGPPSLLGTNVPYYTAFEPIGELNKAT